MKYPDFDNIRVKHENIRTAKILVPGHGSSNILVISQKGPFRLREISVTDKVGQNFLVEDIKVGKNSQFISPGAVPASFFVETNQQKGLSFDVLQRGMTITLSVVNMCGETEEFEAVLTGDVLKNGYDVSDCDRTFLGLGCTDVRPRSKAVVNVQPQVTFMPDSLVVPRKILDVLRLRGVYVVGESVMKPEDLDLCGPCSSATLSTGRSTSWCLTWPCVAMQIGDWFTVEVENETDVVRTFCGVAVGKTMNFPK